MSNIRSPAVAGTFYTDDPAQLRDQVSGFLARASSSAPCPKALIAPHAGYIYSGPIAGSAYAPVAGLRDRVRRVVLLGPAHRVYVDGVAASSANAFATPLGSIPVDTAAVAQLVRDYDFVEYSDAAHELEHSLEVQLPFLQVLLTDFQILPLAVGGAHPSQIEALLDALWGGEETLIVISSDLSHYHDYATARDLDGQTTRWIETFASADITGEHACGQIPIRGLLRAAVKHGLRCETLDLRNSGDTAGPRDRVVGYGAYVFYRDATKGATPEDERRRLTDLACRSIGHGLAHGRPVQVVLEEWPPHLCAERATFVTLHRHGSLRGCIGSLKARRPLVEDIADNAYAAAFQDPRFAALSNEELPDLDIHIAVLSPPEPLEFRSPDDLLDQIRPGMDGLILSEGEHRGTFLPSVWEQLPERHAFLRHLKRKAGLPEDYWSDSLTVSRYTTESW